MPKVELSKTYNPAAIESRIYENWESGGFLKSQIHPDRKPFVISLPPPNVTGMLTIGHVLNHTLQDILIRWHRLRGEDALWVPGTDHAGIATQAKVEAALAKQGLNRHDLGREELMKRIWAWREEYGGIILRQMRRLGTACDWSRERFTFDESLSRAVATIFVRLYEKGLVYRGKRIVNWDPDSHTALSDEQVEYRNVKSHLWYIRYPLTDGSGYLMVATTRPETMLGDSAVAVHPDDDRYRYLQGKTIRLPLTERDIPIVPDNFVDREFGTGCVKVTPSHDPNDFEIGQRHNLEFITVIGTDGNMTDQAPEVYRGLSREKARELVVQHLEEQGLMEKIEPYTHSVGHNERTGTVIEPLLSEQWFVSMQELAKPAIEAVRNGEVKFYPEHWKKTYYHWLENVRDWCISRQIWWGHRIPLWTVKETGEVICSIDDPTKDPKYAGLTLEQDPDVLDTWFSSWLWPFSIFGWPEETDDLKHYFPTTTLVTAADIIFLWVARMVMASKEVFGKAPFQNVYFNGLVRDLKGRKFSKSLGNSPDPLEVIDTYGADALRFTIVSLTPLGGDIRFGSELCEMGRNFANKLWNATRFVLMNLPEEDGDFAFQPVDGLNATPENLIDKWITSAFFHAVRDVTDALEEYRFSDAAKRIYGFVWNDFCDWYVELTKTRLRDKDSPDRQAAVAHALGVLHGVVRLLHPFMPFLTEELFQTLKKVGGGSLPSEHASETIMDARFPVVNEGMIDAEVEEEFSLLQGLIDALRNIRGELHIPRGTKMQAGIRGAGKVQEEFLKSFLPFIVHLAELEKIEFTQTKPRGCAAAVVQNLEVFVPLEGLVDVEQEQARLSKEHDRLQRLVQGSRGKLGNENFIQRANPEVVEAERQKLTDLEAALEKVTRHLEEIKEITKG